MLLELKTFLLILTWVLLVVCTERPWCFIPGSNPPWTTDYEYKYFDYCNIDGDPVCYSYDEYPNLVSECSERRSAATAAGAFGVISCICIGVYALFCLYQSVINNYNPSIRSKRERILYDLISIVMTATLMVLGLVLYLSDFCGRNLHTNDAFATIGPSAPVAAAAIFLEVIITVLDCYLEEEEEENNDNDKNDNDNTSDNDNDNDHNGRRRRRSSAMGSSRFPNTGDENPSDDRNVQIEQIQKQLRQTQLQLEQSQLQLQQQQQQLNILQQQEEQQHHEEERPSPFTTTSFTTISVSNSAPPPPF